MVNIAEKEQLLSYLREKGIFGQEDALTIKYFSGGVSGVAAFASDGKQDVLIKQALTVLKVKDNWECDPGRIIIEHKALEVYAELVPECVPFPLFSDEENMVIGRAAAPLGCVMWKEQLLNGLLDFRTAEMAVDALCKVHDLSAADPKIREKFQNNTVFYELRVEPYIKRVVEKHPDLEARSEQIIHRLMNEKVALIHGDYSPKNILVADGRIYILDFEVAHFGHPSFDIAFFFNHFMLKAVKHKEWSEAYLNMMLFMAERYFAKVRCVNSEKLEQQSAELLAFMMLARVDGKSPVEYLTLEEDKEIVRKIAYGILNEGAEDFKAAADVLRKTIQ